MIEKYFNSYFKKAYSELPQEVQGSLRDLFTYSLYISIFVLFISCFAFSWNVIVQFIVMVAAGLITTALILFFIKLPNDKEGR